MWEFKDFLEKRSDFYKKHERYHSLITTIALICFTYHYSPAVWTELIESSLHINQANLTATTKKMSSLEKEINILKNEEDFRVLGLSIVGPGGCDRSTSIKIHNRVFRAHFGAGWKTVAYVWKFLKEVEEDISKEKNEMKKSIFEKKHLLWCLYFFKLYTSEDTAAKSLGCTPKTYRKWTSICTKDIAFLYPFFVSIELEKKFFVFFTHHLYFSFLSSLSSDQTFKQVQRRQRKWLSPFGRHHRL